MKEPQCTHPPPLCNDDVIGCRHSTDSNLLHHHYQKEEEVKEAQCAHPPPLDNDNVIGTNQCLSTEGRVEHHKTQPNDSSAVVWFSFWCSTRFTSKKVTNVKP